jgi:hypothetical protein
MNFPKKVIGKRKDNNETVSGSLMYDFDQDCWRIIIQFWDVEAPKLENEIGITAYEVDIETVKVVNI